MPTIGGIETEYALIFRPHNPDGYRPVRRILYEVIEELVATRRPSLPAKLLKRGRFISNGGLIHYEARASRANEGLLEVATPECSDPKELALYHHAMDHLIEGIRPDAERLLETHSANGSLIVGKNATDGKGNFYGCHENYFVHDPIPGWAFLPIGLLLIPFWISFAAIVTIAFFALVVIILGMLGLGILAVTLYGAFGLLSRLPVVGFIPAKLRDAVSFGGGRMRGWVESDADPITKWYGAFVGTILRPWCFLYSLFLRTFAFRSVRKNLTSFLVTRLVLGGSGRVVPEEGKTTEFELSQRARCIKALFRVYLDDHRRPIYDVKTFIRSPLDALRQKRRLHLMLGDSNMSETATYVKIGATWLILDMIEAGQEFESLRIANPVRALRIFSDDADLEATARMTDGSERTAIEIQRGYFEQAREYYAGDDRPWVNEVLTAWETALDTLAAVPRLLYRELDWVGKRDLVDELMQKNNTSLANLSEGDDLLDQALKIDLRYHELSPEGYQRKLIEAGLVRRVFSDEEILAATHDPPSGTRAAIRGERIRFHSGSNPEPKVNWEGLTLGSGFRKQTEIFPPE